MHTGRTSIFADHDRKSIAARKIYADVHPNLMFDPQEFQPEEFKPTIEQDGYFANESLFKPGGIEVSFYFPGIRRKLDEALSIVLTDIEIAFRHNSLMGLVKVNMKTLAFRVSGGPIPTDSSVPDAS